MTRGMEDKEFSSGSGSGTVVSGPSPSLTGGVSELEGLRRADAEITAALKGPMSNIERALMVADRKDIRAAIARASGDA